MSKEIMTAEELYATGVDYLTGENGKEQNNEKAAEYFLKSAEMGYPPAYFPLGGMYIRGNGVEPDYEQAKKWLELAVKEYEDADAAAELALLLHSGLLGTTDYAAAIPLYEFAAARGSKNAQNNLASLYSDHSGIEGLEQDYEKAGYYMRILAADGNEQAIASLEILGANGYGNDPKILGPAYYEGIWGKEKDWKKAVYWMQKAAESGDPKFMTHYATMLVLGNGIIADLEEANQWLQKAAEKDFADAQAYLAYNYLKGIGVDRDVTLANYWCKLALKQDNELAKQVDEMLKTEGYHIVSSLEELSERLEFTDEGVFLRDKNEKK